MKKLLFLFGYFLAPAVPTLLYLLSVGAGLGLYAVSMILGIFAFWLAAGQFFLASRPAWVLGILGAKGLLSLHRAAPLLILALAFVHSQLKEASGFEEATFQARLGLGALILFAAAVVLALLFMAGGRLAGLGALRRLKSWAAERIGLGYPRIRALHNVTAAAGAAALVHAMAASSSSLAANPAGAGLLAAWMLLSLGLYLAYKLRGRRGRTAPV